MHKRRLLKLADLLEADAKNKKGIKFDLSTWAAPSDSNWMSRTFDKKLDTVPVDCGTTACAVGLACISGAFKRAGLTHAYRRPWVGSGWMLQPKFDGSKDFKAVQKLFEINQQSAEFLFSASEYPDDKTEGAKAERFVAKRIRDFVAGKVAP